MGLGGAMNSGISGLQAFSNAMSVIGNNLANTNTAGFKASRTLFSDLMPDTVTGTGGTSQIGRGASLSVVDDIFKQGSIESTSSNLDLAIDGSGFFIVRNPDNQSNFYTRAGTFRLDEEGFLVNPEGYIVQGYARNEEGGFKDLTGDIQINTRSFVEGEASSKVELTTNLDANVDADEGAAAWNIDQPTASSDFATTSEVYDSLGETHLITTYFKKTDENTWEYHQTVPSADIKNEQGYPADGLARISGGEVADGLTNNGDLTVNGENVAAAERDAAAIASAIHDADPAVNAAAENSQDFSINSDLLAAEDPSAASDFQFDLDVTTSDGSSPKTITVSRDADGPDLTGQDIADAINDETSGFGAGTASFDSETGVLSINGQDGHNITISNIKFGTDDNLTADNAYEILGLESADPDPFYGSIELASESEITLGQADGTSAIENAGFDPSSPTAQPTDPTMVEVARGVFDFNEKGRLKGITPYSYNASERTWTAGDPVDSSSQDWPNVTIPSGNLDWNNGSDTEKKVDYEMNLTQFATDSKVVTQQANGYSSGYLTDLKVDKEGTIIATYSNGETRDMARLALGKFSNNNGLEKLGENLYQATNDSGPADIGMPGSGVGKIFSNSLEQSTVDIAEEFTKMITTQRSFQANSKTITTTDEMLNEVINMKR